MIPSPLLDREEAAQYLKMGQRSFDRLKLPRVGITRRPRFRKCDLDAYIESKLIMPAEPKAAPKKKKPAKLTGAKVSNDADWMAMKPSLRSRWARGSEQRPQP